MAFTYIGDRSTDLDKLRSNVGDTVENSGPLPGGGNLQDAELGAWITEAGGVDEATALVLDALAVRWATYANITVGPRREELAEVAKGFRMLATQWRKDHAIHSTSSAGARFVTRVDGYSDNYDAGET